MKTEITSKELLEIISGIMTAAAPQNYVNIEAGDIFESLAGLDKVFFCKATGETPLEACNNAFNNPTFMECEITSAKKMIIFFTANNVSMRDLADAIEHTAKILPEDGDILWGCNNNAVELVSVIILGGGNRSGINRKGLPASLK